MVITRKRSPICITTREVVKIELEDSILLWVLSLGDYYYNDECEKSFFLIVESRPQYNYTYHPLLHQDC